MADAHTCATAKICSCSICTTITYSAHADGKKTKLAHATLDPKFNG